MSSFGEYNIKTQIQKDLDCIASQWFGHDTYYMTAEEKVKFLGELFEVLHYMFGEW